MAAPILAGTIAVGALAWWLVRRKREQKPTLLDPDLFKAPGYRYVVSQQLLQQIALGGRAPAAR